MCLMGKLFTKHTVMKSILNKAGLLFLSSFLSVMAWAQNETKKLDVDINIDKGPKWYEQTWVWVVGGAVFILLLVALLRGGGSKKEA